MKKMSLKKLNLETDELLQKEQLKTILGGGYDGQPCVAVCNTGTAIGTPNCYGYTKETVCDDFDGLNFCVC